MRKVFLEKNRSINSVNRTNFIDVDLKSTSRLFPYNNVNDVLNLNNLYTYERDNCNKYRVILTVNPICSNVLFNTRTEVVRYEGSSGCTLVLEQSDIEKGKAINRTNLDWRQAIRDTEYTHPELFEDKEPYVYHCGLDIFNNHRLRTNDFIYVNKTNESDKSTFNTLADLVRSNEGVNVQEVVSLSNPRPTLQNVHIYQYDNVTSTLYETFSEKLTEKDGWYGFTNKTDIAIPNASSDEITINKIMNNNKSCEQIDLYPDRSLYSFIPKVNKYRHRIEKNWDYCLVYPFEKDSAKLKEIFSASTENMGIKTIEYSPYVSPGGTTLIRVKSLLKHNLLPNSLISLSYEINGSVNELNNKVRVVSVGLFNGSEKDNWFSFAYNDIAHDFIIENGELKPKNGNGNITFYFKKTVSGVDCEYYFRKFKKITNNGQELTSVVNKLAYGENIYGDRIAQIVFTDDINVEGLVDHRGRPLTEIYLLIIKRNKGYKKWYDNNTYTDSDIEFSHCFGKVTSGIELDENVIDYNVRKLHNLSGLSGGTAMVFGNLTNGITPKPIEDDITIEGTDEFYGDIVEYNPVNCTETILSKVQYRFNTAQRESTNERFKEVFFDTILSDDYDNGGFVSASTKLNTLDGTEFNGNLAPEGYFYSPFTRIQLRELSDAITKVSGTLLKYDGNSYTRTRIDTPTEGFKITFLNNYNFIKNDDVIIYDNVKKETYFAIVNGISGNTIDFYCDVRLYENQLRDRGYYFIKTNEGVPKYATYVPNSNSFVWRETIAPSELANDSLLYNRPFANGCFYIEQNVNLFLKRQDPVNKYGLLNCNDKNPMGQYNIYGWDEVDFENIEYNNGDLTPICY